MTHKEIVKIIERRRDRFLRLAEGLEGCPLSKMSLVERAALLIEILEEIQEKQK